jgi:hypothetical protein
MQIARIFRTTKNPTQSGRGRTGDWMLEFAPGEPKRIDPLTGWSGSGDTQAQVRLRFDSKEDAIAYAERHGWRWEVEEGAPARAEVKPKSYSDNFRFNRGENWTH